MCMNKNAKQPFYPDGKNDFFLCRLPKNLTIFEHFFLGNH